MPAARISASASRSGGTSMPGLRNRWLTPSSYRMVTSSTAAVRCWLMDGDDEARTTSLATSARWTAGRYDGTPRPAVLDAIGPEGRLGTALGDSGATSTGAVAQATRPIGGRPCVIPCVNHRFFLWVRGAPPTPLLRDRGRRGHLHQGRRASLHHPAVAQRADPKLEA